MKIHYRHHLNSLSRLLRKQCTLAEVLLWKEIKGRRLKGYQFMRQKPVLSYILDFYCSPLKLAIEIDGASHDAKVEEDVKRQKEIEKLGIAFLRFTEKEVREDIDSVLWGIEEWIERRETTPASQTRHPLY